MGVGVLLLLLGLLCFVAAAAGASFGRLNIGWLGLACVTLAQIIG